MPDLTVANQLADWFNLHELTILREAIQAHYERTLKGPDRTALRDMDTLFASAQFKRTTADSQKAAR